MEELMALMGGGMDPLAGGVPAYGAEMFTPPQLPSAPVQQEEPWWKKFLMGGLSGMASGAGAQTSGEAMQLGYAGEMARQEKERQKIKEARQIQLQEYLFKSQMMDSFLNRLKVRQDLEMAPQELKVKIQQAHSQRLAAMAAANQNPVANFPATEAGMKKAMEYAQQQGKTIAEMNPEESGDQIYLYDLDRTKLTPPDYQQVELLEDGTPQFVPRPNVPWTSAVQYQENANAIALQKQKDKLAREQMESAERIAAGNNAAQITSASIYASRPTASTESKPLQSGELMETQKYVGTGIQKRLDDLEQKESQILSQLPELDSRPKTPEQGGGPSDRALAEKALQDLRAAKDQLQKQYDQNLLQRPVGTILRDRQGNTEGTVMNYDEKGMIVKLPNGRQVYADPQTLEILGPYIDPNKAGAYIPPDWNQDISQP